MNLLEELTGLGVNVSEGLERVMDDTSLYEMMLGMFISSVDDNPISLEEFDSAELEPLIKKVHILKGVTGNLALTTLFDKYTEVLTLLRDGQARKAREGYEGLLSPQSAILDCIRKHQGD